MKKILIPLLVVSALSGCKDNEPTHDVQYYLDNPKERTEKLAECKNNPGEKALAANCLNAGEAQRKAMFQGDGMPKIR
ncbi:EexN family lipoprotein [Salmonella enterica subsp. enterica serovar Kentucky]|nr:entry exclusion protein [Salmonella enterica subsp. enterica serovar Heidelberg]EFN4685931.1 entry exclusion protein [Escherichia coli]EJW5843913.1 EexN family lipoprotein [Salmonella enterica subsp. enterica serovar Kentucky]